MNVQVDYSLIGRRIREHRLKVHMTQAELAERSGVCQQYIGVLERGLGIPSLATVLALCHVFGIEPNDLLLHVSQYDSDAPCSLHSAPSPLQLTLSALWMKDTPEDGSPLSSFDLSRLPPYDVTMKDPSS